MRYVSPATVVVFLSSLLPGALFGQITPANLSITNYRLVSEDRLDRTHSILTYGADLINSGPAIPAVTATVRSLLSSIQVQPGLGNLQFPPTPAGGRTSSTNTFSILVDRTGNTDFSNLDWSFVAPVANAGPNQTGTVGVTVTLNGSGSTNPIGIGTIQYFWSFSSRPPGSNAVIQNMTTVSPTFVPDVQGVYVVLMQISNGVGNDSSSVTVTVGPGNTPPVAVAGPGQTVAVGATVTLNGTGSHDADGDPLTYSWTLITRPAGSNAVLTGATTPSPTFVADKKGNFVAQLVVNDGKVNSLPDTVTISTSNTRPVANAGPNQAIAAPGLVQLDGSASSDADGDPLTYRWSLTTLPSGSTAALNSTTAVRPTFTADLPGTYVAQLIVNDGTDDSVASTVTITVGKGNTPPVANAGPAQTVKAGATVMLSGANSSDADGDPLTFSWSFTSRPTGSVATLTGAATVSPSFVADKPGQYVVQLIVNDGKVNSTPSTVTISSTNTPPVANAGPNQVVTAPVLVQLDGSGSTDVDGNTLTYRWSLTSIPSGSTAVLSSTTAVKPTFTADLAGTYIAQLIVNDGFVDSAPSTVTITSNQPLQPTAIAGPNQTVAKGALVTLAGTGTDPQNLPLTFKWSLTSKPVGSTAVLSNTTISNPTFTADLGGSYVAQLIVNNGVLDSQPSSVTIKTTNTQPVANAGVNRFVATGATVALDGTGSHDADNDPLTFSWTFTSRPPGSSAVLVNANTATPTFTADVAGTYVIQLIVNDGLQDSNPSTVSITAGQNPISLTPSPLNIASNASGTLTVAIVTAPAAGSGGQVINLSVLPGGVVTVPASVTIPEGATSVTATITPVSVGTGTIFASATNFQPGSVTVNVTQPAISISVNPSTVGVTKTATGSITLSGPAPAAGVTVALAADNSGIADFPATVNIAGNSTTGTFTLTGVKGGTVSITGSSQGYANGSATVTVVALGSIMLQSSAVVAPGQSLPFSVSLVTIAPVGGVTINLVSGDTNILTVPATVFIPEGATAPTTPVQITGVNFGSTTITASAGGFIGDSKTVQVAANLSFAQQSINVGVGSTGNVALNLTGAAPQGGVTVTLVSDTPNIASVPNNVNIPQNASTVNVPILGVAAGGPATITASSSVAGIASGSIKVTVVLGVSITTSALNSGTVGTPYTATVSASGGVAPLTFTATGLPAGLSISSDGKISGTPTAAGTSTPSITVTDSNTPHSTDTKTISLTIVNPIAFQATTLTAGVVGAAYDQTVSATGGTTPYTFTATGLPAGLSISAGGQITGTPTAAGTSIVVITVTDSTNPTHLTATSGNLSLVIGSAPVITTSSLPNGFVGAPYNFGPISATGGTTPYTFTATGLPAGLSISAAGVISGTPTATATGTVTITLTDSTAPNHSTATTSLPLSIGTGLGITTSSLPVGLVGVAYTPFQMGATGGTSPYTFTGTGLPAGLSISAAGVVSGTPTAAGSGNASITVTDSTPSNHLTTTASVSFTILQPPSITTTSLPGGFTQTAYTAPAITATGGTPPYTFSATGLPTGLAISADGVISGTPTVAGTSTPTITVTDSTSPTHLTGTANLSIAIAPDVTITTTTLPAGTLGVPYIGAQVNAANGTTPYTFTATGLPPGLVIGASGQITGTPTAMGSFTPSITVTDSTAPTHLTATTSNLTILIMPPNLTVQPLTLPAGFVAIPYSVQVVASGGVPPLSYSQTGLPPGVDINPTTGLISGTPTTQGSFVGIVVTVTDSTAGTHQSVSLTNLSVVIGNTPATITPVASNVTVGQNLEAPITFVLSAVSGDPITVSVMSNNPNVLLVDARTPDAIGCAVDQNGNCAGRFSINLPPGLNTFSVIAQGLASSGTAAITASATGFADGTATVTLVPSGFVLAGPNGIGAAFDSNPGVASQLAVTSERLDGNGNPVEIQEVRAFYQVDANGKPLLDGSGKPIPAPNPPVLLSNSNGNVGAPVPQITVAAGSSTAFGLFNATLTPGSTVVTANVPNGFSTPAGGVNSVAITVKSTQISPANVNVGQNLETLLHFSLQGAPIANMGFLVTSKDATRLLFSPDSTSTGAASIIVTIGGGFSTSPDFFAYGLASTGSIAYTVCQWNGDTVNPQCVANPVFAAADGTVTLWKSGFVLQSPFGQIGGDFFTSTLSGNSQITVLSARLDASGGFLETQALRGGITASIPVTSANTAVGTISASPVTISGGTGSGATQFAPVGQGSTLISAVAPAGFTLPTQFASITATVTLPKITLDSNVMVGNKLQAVGTILLSVPNAVVTLTVTSGSVTLATTATGAGSTQITVPVTGNSATYFIRGGASSGTATVSGTAPNYVTGTGTFILSQSGFVIGGPGGEGSPFPDSIPLSGGPAPITVKSAVLDLNGNFLMEQALAGGGSNVLVPVTNQDATVGTFPATVTYTAGSDSVDTNFTPLKVGQTKLTVGAPSGFSIVQPPAYTSVTVSVQ
jgi:hypothetical protein